jgi:predicted permease
MAPGVEHPGNMYHAVSYGDTVDIWTPFTFADPQDRGSHYLDGIGRLRAGVSIRQAQSEMNSAMQQLAREHPNGDSGWNVIVVPLQKEIVGRSERLLFVLLGVVSLVLLLACVNAANLLLARATARQREIGIRAAVGAVRARLIQQMLTESLLLAVLGGALGALLMFAGVRMLVKALPADFPRAGDIHADVSVFIFTLFLAFTTGLLFGIVPALQGSRVDLRDSLHERGRSSTSNQGTLRLRSMLVVSEVTLACVLLIGAGLLLRSFANLLRTDPGFRAEQVLTAGISLPQEGYKDAKAISGFYNRLLPRLRDMPGLAAAGAGSDLPWTGWDENIDGFLIQGEVPVPHQQFHARYHVATPGYFQALGIPLVRGRFIEPRDRADSQNVIVINRQLARYWRHGDALGGKMAFDDHPKEKDWLTVIGIVGDVKDSPKNSAAEAGFWWPLTQQPFPQGEFSVAIRSTQDSKVVADRLRAAVRELDGNLAVADVRTMRTVADGSYATPRFGLLLVALFAALALTLAAIGTYAVISYSVEQRFHEFGVRMALGARSWDVTQTVLGSGMKLTALGVLMGIVLGIAFSRLLGSLLYGVNAADPLAVGATCLIVVLVAAIACYVPAWRATRADPMTALRTD